MINLIGAELDRLRARRVVMIGLVVLLIALAGYQVAVGFSVRQPTPAAVAEARVQYDKQHADWERHKEENLAAEKECREQNPDQPPEACSSEPKPDWFLPPVLGFGEAAGTGVLISVVLTSLVFLIIGASSIGAEYSSGAIANWMSFVPDRLRVHASKLITVLVAAVLVTAVATALTVASTAVLVKINSGRVGGLGDVIAAGARGLIISAVCVTAGFALALVFRHTIAALGAVLGYLVVRFVLLILSEPIPALQRIKPWTLENNARAVLDHGYRYTDEVKRLTADGITYDQVERVISFGHGLTYLIILFVIMAVGSAVVFRRRDIT